MERPLADTTAESVLTISPMLRMISVGTTTNATGVSELATYKDFEDAAPYASGFLNTAERPIARLFESGIDRIEQQCLQLGGKPYVTDAACRRAFVFHALPKVPVVLMFNDAMMWITGLILIG